MTIQIAQAREYDGQNVTLRGFVKQVRDLKKMQFVILRDISGVIQVTVFKNQQNAQLNAQVAKLTAESSVIISGVVHVDDFVKLGGVEILAEQMTVANLANSFHPIDITDYAADSNRDLRLDWRFLDLRAPERQLIFRVQTTAEMAMREFWIAHNFIEIHSPKLMGNPSESGAELFELDYFGRTAYLAQSPQFYKQMGIAAGFERVFEIGPVFRANKSSTSRHDTEFTSVDCEMAWIDSVEDVMQFEERWIAHFLQRVAQQHGQEIEAMTGRTVVVPTVPFPRITMAQAKQIIAERDYQVPPETKGDLDPTAERLLGQWALETHGHQFVFVTGYPSSIRPFYHMRPESDPTSTCSFDLLWNGLEVTTGAQREHRHAVLRAQAIEKGLDPDGSLRSYMDYFDYGCPPHGGFGFGLTRMLMNLLGYTNVREVTYIYRGVDRLFP